MASFFLSPAHRVEPHRHTAEPDLISQALGGDEFALETLIRNNLADVYGLAFRLVRNQPDAEDLTQEIFVKVWRHLKKFDQSKAFRPWLLAIARNTCLDFFKRRRQEIPFAALAEATEIYLARVSPTAELSAAEKLDQTQTALNLNEQLKNLPQNDQALIKMRIDDNRSFREISAIQKKPLNTVKSRYRRAILALGKILKRTDAPKLRQ